MIITSDKIVVFPSQLKAYRNAYFSTQTTYHLSLCCIGHQKNQSHQRIWLVLPKNIIFMGMHKSFEANVFYNAYESIHFVKQRFVTGNGRTQADKISFDKQLFRLSTSKWILYSLPFRFASVKDRYYITDWRIYVFQLRLYHV